MEYKTEKRSFGREETEEAEDTQFIRKPSRHMKKTEEGTDMKTPGAGRDAVSGQQDISHLNSTGESGGATASGQENRTHAGADNHAEAGRENSSSAGRKFTSESSERESIQQKETRTFQKGQTSDGMPEQTADTENSAFSSSFQSARERQKNYTLQKKQAEKMEKVEKPEEPRRQKDRFALDDDEEDDNWSAGQRPGSDGSERDFSDGSSERSGFQADDERTFSQKRDGLAAGKAAGQDSDTSGGSAAGKSRNADARRRAEARHKRKTNTGGAANEAAESQDGSAEGRHGQYGAGRKQYGSGYNFKHQRYDSNKEGGYADDSQSQRDASQPHGYGYRKADQKGRRNFQSFSDDSFGGDGGAGKGMSNAGKAAKKAADSVKNTAKEGAKTAANAAKEGAEAVGEVAETATSTSTAGISEIFTKPLGAATRTFQVGKQTFSKNVSMTKGLSSGKQDLEQSVQSKAMNMAKQLMMKAAKETAKFPVRVVKAVIKITTTVITAVSTSGISLAVLLIAAFLSVYVVVVLIVWVAVFLLMYGVSMGYIQVSDFPTVEAFLNLINPLLDVYRLLQGILWS